jgi:hypothetical protein
VRRDIPVGAKLNRVIPDKVVAAAVVVGEGVGAHGRLFWILTVMDERMSCWMPPELIDQLCKECELVGLMARQVDSLEESVHYQTVYRIIGIRNGEEMRSFVLQ